MKQTMAIPKCDLKDKIMVAKDRKSPNILILVGILYRPKIMVASPNLQSSSDYAEAFSLSWFKVNRKSSILKSNFN